MSLLSLTLKLTLHTRRALVVLLHIYHQLYKNHQKPDPFAGSCRVQLVTRDEALREAFNSTHVALPVQRGFEDFMRVGQLLWLVILDRKPGGGHGGQRP